MNGPIFERRQAANSAVFVLVKSLPDGSNMGSFQPRAG